jgi:hypothetical protein
VTITARDRSASIAIESAKGWCASLSGLIASTSRKLAEIGIDQEDDDSASSLSARLQQLA